MTIPFEPKLILILLPFLAYMTTISIYLQLICDFAHKQNNRKQIIFISLFAGKTQVRLNLSLNINKYLGVTVCA